MSVGAGQLLFARQASRRLRSNQWRVSWSVVISSRDGVCSVFEPSQYELVDFGAGRKLERFGTELLDRPSPAAEGIAIADPGLWGEASARFDLDRSGKGQWSEGTSPAWLRSEGCRGQFATVTAAC